VTLLISRNRMTGS